MSRSSATSSSPSASVDLPSVPIAAKNVKVRPSAQHPLSPRRRKITMLLPPHGSSSWGRRGGTLKHLSGLIPKGKSHLTKYERRRHSPGRRFQATPGRHAMLRGRLSKSSRPPRPAQRILLDFGVVILLFSSDRSTPAWSKLELSLPPAHTRADTAGRS